LTHAVPLFTHIPASPQVCGCWPLHPFCPGEQVPEHCPLRHVELVHAAELPQVPLAVQLSTPLPEGEHWVALGPQTPWHEPLTHVWLVHAEAVPHMPLESHVATPLPEHVVDPGEHTPVHDAAPAVPVHA
jgi:hypothetical protein